MNSLGEFRKMLDYLGLFIDLFDEDLFYIEESFNCFLKVLLLGDVRNISLTGNTLPEILTLSFLNFLLF